MAADTLLFFCLATVQSVRTLGSFEMEMEMDMEMGMEMKVEIEM